MAPIKDCAIGRLMKPVLFSLTRLRSGTVMLAAGILLFAIPAIAAKYCGLPIGAGAREASWRAVQPLLPALKKIAGDRTFVLITRPTYRDLLPHLSAFRDRYTLDGAEQLAKIYGKDWNGILANSKYTTAKAKFRDEALVTRLAGSTGNKYPREFLRVILFEADKGAVEEVARLRTQAAQTGRAQITYGKGKDVQELTYVYTNDPRIQRSIGLKGVEHGVTLETSGSELAYALSADSPLAESYKHAGILFLDDVRIDADQIMEASGTPLVRLPAMQNRDYRTLAELIHGRDGNGFGVFNLLPETAEQAAPWGFHSRQSRDYSEAGDRL